MIHLNRILPKTALLLSPGRIINPCYGKENEATYEAADDAAEGAG